jgi:hypothetical protein
MQLILDINENKFEAFINFVKTLDYVSIKELSNNAVPQWTQDIVMNRKKDNEGFIDEETFFSELDKEIK